MPLFKRPDAEIYYEVHGKGFPLLLYAPGGLKSQLGMWKESPANPGQPAAWMMENTLSPSSFLQAGTLACAGQRSKPRQTGHR